MTTCFGTINRQQCHELERCVHRKPQFRTRFHYTTLNKTSELGRVGCFVPGVSPDTSEGPAQNLVFIALGRKEVNRQETVKLNFSSFDCPLWRTLLYLLEGGIARAVPVPES
jgi:hypothetical protein